MISQYEGAKTRVRVDCELSEEMEVKLGMHQGSMQSPYLFAVLVDAITEFDKEGVLSELLYADDIVLMSQIIEGLRNKFIKLKEAYQSLKVNLGKTKVMVSGGNTKDGMPKNKVDPCGVCSLRANANSVLCVQCSKWIHGRCAGMKRVTQKY